MAPLIAPNPYPLTQGLSGRTCGCQLDRAERAVRLQMRVVDEPGGPEDLDRVAPEVVRIGHRHPVERRQDGGPLGDEDVVALMVVEAARVSGGAEVIGEEAVAVHRADPERALAIGGVLDGRLADHGVGDGGNGPTVLPVVGGIARLGVLRTLAEGGRKLVGLADLPTRHQGE